MIARTRDPQADLRARIAAGKALGELGDPRLAEQPVTARVKPLLPAFAAIPGGEYRIGGDPEGYPDEQPAREVTLAGFELAVHPVTNAEYARFLQAGGYREDAYWPGRALAWRNGEIGQEATQQAIRENRQDRPRCPGTGGDRRGDSRPLQVVPGQREMVAGAHQSDRRGLRGLAAAGLSAARRAPSPSRPYWRSLTWGNPAQPVVGVCWYEARAYCLWLNDLLGSEAYRLPSEAEWEAAGRGRGKWRRYAWPGDFDPLRANTAETRLGVTTPVGVFPEGATPDTGLLDLCGNVWEWTATPWSEGEDWAPAAGAADGEQVARRVVRGGSWGDTRAVARLGCRDGDDPDDRDGDLGFRVCRASPI